ncbi:hypothetical protein [Metasolibacillus meyeri]|uniref:hypothetical protein n=1 Tax=Metasolibacillus meyeri TaxID=1071052 RepID=UPI000D3128C1|nr:hypothetical protein [Metasolibacillus meyeri]
MHSWLLTDDIVVYYYHHYEASGLIYNTLQDICARLNIPINSFKARIRNLKYVLTNGQQGLSNVAQQTKEVAEMFKYAKQNDPNFQNNLQAVVNRILS